MKKNSAVFILSILILGTLTSCGAKKTSATLEVTNSALSVSNNTYTGGLVIMGKSSSGNFTIPVSFGSGSGNSVTLELARDVWTFSAVAWEGSTFQGNTLCSSKTVDISDDEVTVNLDMTYAKCASQTTAFGNSNFHSGNAFLPFKVATCKALYRNTTPSPVDNTTPISFCTSGASIDAAFKVWAGSIKIEVKQNINGRLSSGISTSCISGTQGMFTPGLSIPSLGLPITVTLYEDSGCPVDTEKKIADYEFPGVIAAAVSGQDTFLNDVSSSTNLFLPANRTKRGYSSFLALQPFVTCNGNPCLSAPTSIPGSKDRIIAPGSDFVIGQRTATQNCSTILSVATPQITGADSSAVIENNCKETDDGQIALKTDFSNLSSSPSVNVTFDNTSFINTSVATDNSYHIFKLSLSVLGYPITPAISPNIQNSFESLFENSGRDRGILSEVSDFFAPEGPAGILGITNCLNDVKSSTVNFFEDGEWNYYRIKLDRSPRLTDSLIADVAYSTSDLYDSRIIGQKLRSLSDPIYDTIAVLDIHCADQVGRLESYEVDGDKVERRVHLWNTRTDGARKSYVLSSEVERDAVGIESFQNSFAIGENYSVTTQAIAAIYKLEGKRSIAPNYNLEVKVSQAHINTSTGRIMFINAGVGTPGVLINDATFDGALTTYISSPGYNKFCTNSSLGTFNSITLPDLGDCDALLQTEASAFTYANLRYSTFNLNFTTNFSSIDL